MKYLLNKISLFLSATVSYLRYTFKGAWKTTKKIAKAVLRTVPLILTIFVIYTFATHKELVSAQTAAFFLTMCSGFGFMYGVLLDSKYFDEAMDLAKRWRKLCSEYSETLKSSNGLAKTALRDYEKSEYERSIIEKANEQLQSTINTLTEALNQKTIENTELRLLNKIANAKLQDSQEQVKRIEIEQENTRKLLLHGGVDFLNLCKNYNITVYQAIDILKAHINEAENEYNSIPA